MAWRNQIIGMNTVDLAPLGKALFDTSYDLQAVGEYEAERRVDGIYVFYQAITQANFNNGYLAATTSFRTSLTNICLTPYVTAAGITAIHALEPTTSTNGPATAATPAQQLAGAQFIKTIAKNYLIPGIDQNTGVDSITSYLYFSLGSAFLQMLTPSIVPVY